LVPANLTHKQAAEQAKLAEETKQNADTPMDEKALAERAGIPLAV
jgi:hypothetical protein